MGPSRPWGPGHLGSPRRGAGGPVRLLLLPRAFWGRGFRVRAATFSVALTVFPALPRQDYISKMDPASTLGLSTESIHGYSISHVKRVLDAEPPELPPCRRGVNNISVSLKGRCCLSG